MKKYQVKNNFKCGLGEINWTYPTESDEARDSSGHKNNNPANPKIRKILIQTL